MKTDVTIIGAGLTGLLLAYRLQQHGISFTVVEARDRIGGRIHTIYTPDHTPIEMGATWLGTQHTALFELLQELKIPVFEQSMGGITLFESLSTSPPQRIQIPENQPSSYRIQGGTSTLIHQLANTIPTDHIALGCKVNEISYDEINGCIVKTENQRFTSNKVVSTIPPLLLMNTVRFIPNLPKNITTLANQTHTWMRDSIKVGFSFSKPFWKEHQYSGAVFSNVGPVTELYDHSNYENNKYALKGFIKNEMHLDTAKERQTKVLNQLQKMFGNDIFSYTAYHETLWRNEAFTTFDANQFIFPHQNNGNPVYQNGLYDNNFYIAGSETSPQFGGYMEGAVRSAQNILQHLL